MKKSQKYISTILFLTLLLSLITLPVPAAEVSNIIKADDLEGYAAGTVFNTIGTHTLGDWEFRIASAEDSVAVVTDSVTNSKALKIVKGTSTSALDVFFKFPSVTSGNVKVSYDVRFQNHSRYLEYWGDVRGTNTFKTIFLYRNNYYRSNTNSNNFLFGIGDYTQSYTTIEQYCDFENNQHSIESINKLTSARSGVKTETSNCTEISNILFKLKNQNTGDAYVGHKGQATDGTTENNGIYWIDNVRVEYASDSAEPDPTEPDPVVYPTVSDDLEGHTDGTVFNTAGTHTLGNWSFNIAAGDSVTVMTDPVTNSKALKIVKGTSTSALDVKFNFPSVTSGKVKISYDVRFQNHSRYLEYWGDVRGITNTFKTILLYRNNYYRSNTSGSNFLFGIGDYTQSYTTVEQYCDFENGSHSIESINKLTSARSGVKSEGSNCTEITNVLFKLKNQNPGDTYNDYKGQATDGTAENNGIYWIDNIKIEDALNPVDPVDPVDPVAYPAVRDDLEGHTDGTVFNTAGTHTLGNWSFNIAAGDSVTVMTDPVTNSKALKIVKGTSTSALDVKFNFPSITSDNVKVSYDVRFQNHSRYLEYWGDVRGTTNTFKTILLYRNNYYRSNTNANNFLFGIGDYTQSYTTIEQYCDFENKQHSIESINKLTSERTGAKTESSNCTEITNVLFKLKNQNAGDTYNGYKGQATDGTTENNGIYWIDNISVEKMIINVDADVQKTGNKITLKADIENTESDSYFIVKISDNQGRAVKLDVRNITAGKASYEKEFIMDEAAQSYTLDYYLWKDFISLKPLINANE